MRLLGLALRTLFLLVAIVVTFRVATPQSESLWTAYDTPSDMIRFIIGVTVCIFSGFRFFSTRRIRPTWANGFPSEWPSCRWRCFARLLSGKRSARSVGKVVAFTWFH